ncbi:hypothetical protein [Actinoplanes sp. L3-i22]|uniref:hypothetical protein n=1 Tax=Actinoplanes sp. L3-i22 TaxID=2836373 RepID=UPI001C78F44C|nr:hypothetical protein [Actinoplanes sp. L3-i22]BCY07593.1 hypothetical protein L3i22_026810 [Actinoplanes sp. L3-i22]
MEHFAAVFVEQGGPSFQARHNLTASQYQQFFDDVVPLGLRPRVLSGYAVGGQERFAAVFEQSQGPGFQARHNLTSAQYQQFFDTVVPQGFRPTIVSGYTSGGQERFAAVFEQRQGPTFQARHNLTSAQYQQFFDTVVPQGFRPTILSGYSVGGQERFAAVFEQRQGPAFQAHHNLTSDQYQQFFDTVVPQGFRPTILSGYTSGGQIRFAAVFEQVSGGPLEARHNLTGSQYQQVFDDLVPKGFRPVVVSGYGD